MAELTGITRAQLKNVLRPTAAPLQLSLSKEDGLYLMAVLNQTAKRYPNQDLTDAIPEYMKDLEKVALKYSVPLVEDAIARLRVDPEQDFFPTPNEVSDEIIREKLRKAPSHIYARG